MSNREALLRVLVKAGALSELPPIDSLTPPHHGVIRILASQGRIEERATLALLSRHLEEDPSSPLRGMVLNDLNDIIHRLGQRRGPPAWPFLVGAGAVALAVGLSVGLAPRSPAPQATIDPFSSR